MNTLAINDTEITIKEYQGQRVVTFKEIDQVHQRPNGTAGRNFRSNHNHFVEGVDYFQLSYEEARSTNFVERPNSQGLTLLTETGYLMLVKSFTDDLAWKVQRELVRCYFQVPPPPPGESPELTHSRSIVQAADLLLCIAGECSDDPAALRHIGEVLFILHEEGLLHARDVNRIARPVYRRTGI